MVWPKLLFLGTLLGFSASANALTVTLSTDPVVGVELDAQIDATGDVVCENDITQQSTVFHGSGSRTVSLGTIPSPGFYRLTFTDVDLAQTQVMIVTTFGTGTGVVQVASVNSSLLDKYLALMTGDNAKRWFGTFNKAKALSDNIVAISTTGTLALICVAAPPTACYDTFVGGVSTGVDLAIAYLEHTIDEMITENLLTTEEGAQLKTVITTVKVTKAMSDVDLGDLTSHVLALVQVVAIQLDDPNAQLMIGLGKDTAGQANKLIEVLKKVP